MKRSIRTLPVILLAVMAAGQMLPRLQAASDLKTTVQVAIDALPAESSAAEARIYRVLLDLGEPGLRELCSLLRKPGTGDDSRVRFALQGLVHYVSQPEARSAGKTLAKALARVLATDRHWQVRAFLIRQLQQLGRDAAVPALRPLLTHARLGVPAIDALQAIGSARAMQALRKALARLEGRNRLAAINALGELRAADAARSLMTLAREDDRALRLAALRALAKIGSRAAESVFWAALADSAGAQRAATIEACLLYAQRVAENGDRAIASRLCRAVLADSARLAVHVQSAALTALAQVEGPAALESLATAAQSPFPALRQTALTLAARMPDEQVTAKWLALLESLPPSLQAEGVEMLGQRTDARARAAVQGALHNPAAPVRLAAIRALAQRRDAQAAEALLAHLGRAQESDEIAAVQAALRQLPLDTSRLTALLPSLAPPARVSAIELLASRQAHEAKAAILAQIRSDAAEVRLAACRAVEHVATPDDLATLAALLVALDEGPARDALQKSVVVLAHDGTAPEEPAVPFLQLLPQTTGSQKIILLQTVGRIGGQAALDTLRTCAKQASGTLQDVCVRALANVPDAAAADELLALAATAADTAAHVLLLRGSLRLLRSGALPEGQRLALYRQALASAWRVGEKRLILAALARENSPAALRQLSFWLQDEALSYEAGLAALNMAFDAADDEEGEAGSRRMAETTLALLAGVVPPEVYPRLRTYYESRIIQNHPPEGFVALFNGRDLTGWKGLVKNPPARAKMAPEELARVQAMADSIMRAHWRVENGVLNFDGTDFYNLCTAKEYGDFELLIDWKIEKDGDSGIYLRGSPQVQIWDPDRPAAGAGSGGLYNNQQHPSTPLVRADRPVGEWNTFRVKMVGERVTVHLNDVLVVDNVVLENYWERGRPIYEIGQIELQAHRTPLSFRNIFIRELPRPAVLFSGPLFNGANLEGWTIVSGPEGSWAVKDSVLCTTGRGGGWLSTASEYDNFTLDLEFRVSPGGNSGVFLRAPHQGDPAYTGMEIQVLDDEAEKYAHLKPWQYTGSIYAVQAPALRASRKADTWQKMTITCYGPEVRVMLNGRKIIETNLIEHMDKLGKNPGLRRRRGYIGLQNHGTRVEYRHIHLTELGPYKKSRDEP